MENWKNEQACYIAKQIRDSREWDPAKLAALCDLAGMTKEWKASDGETFEAVVYEAAKRLGVKI